ncbi:DNA-binding response regulator [Mycetocola zhujimingii]|nr:response regulator transcription factor [Mycetocola zhujimingii]AWB86322.1 DNA-binding response regulator [Mycetocola zhujimingii]
MIRVFVVDDHEIVRLGVTNLINGARDMTVVGESDSVRRTLPRVAATHPDVVILDVNLPDGNGIDLCRSIRSEHVDTRCLILTAYGEEKATNAAVMAGASGYVLKSIHGSSLLDSIRQAALGRVLLPPRQTPETLVASTANRETGAVAPHLTEREHQVLGLITGGMTNKQIGGKLGLTEKTVKNYVSGLLAKLGMERRTQAAVYGAAHASPAEDRPVG